MDILELREYCLALPLAEETTPFDETTLVYKVAGKMFLLTDMADFRWINVKFDPEIGRASCREMRSGPCGRVAGPLCGGERRVSHEQTPLEYSGYGRRLTRNADSGVDPRFLSVGGEFPAACQAGNAVAAVGGGQNINPGLRTIQNRQS